MPSKFSVRKRNKIFDNYDICCKICKKNIFFKIFAETTEQQYRNVIHYIIRKKDFCYQNELKRQTRTPTPLFIIFLNLAG